MRRIDAKHKELIYGNRPKGKDNDSGFPI